MTEQLHPGAFEVEDLTPPPDLPPELADELARDEAAPTPAAGDPLEGERAGLLRRLIPALFRLVGAVAGFRVPSHAKAAIAAVWATDPREVAEIAVALAPIVPDRFLASRALRSAGVAGGVLMLASSIAQRAEDTARIRHEVSHHGDSPAPRSEPPADAGEGRDRPRRGGADRPAPVEPESAGAPPPVDGFTGAGLGLGEDR